MTLRSLPARVARAPFRPPSRALGVLPAARVSASKVPSFKVMDVLERAAALEAAGRSVLHLEVGQPQSGAPRAVVDAARAALESDRLGYTPALGLAELREALAAHYRAEYGADVDASRVVVTTGSSAGFVLAFSALFEPGDRVALASSGYPCYRNILNALGCEVVTVDVGERSAFKLTARELEAALARDDAARARPLRGLVLSSPSNPTGAMLAPDELAALCAACDARGVRFVSDEIYHGITFSDAPAQDTALRHSPDALVINSFSKFFSMTGWRLGWLVLPERAPELADAVTRLQQNLFISAPTLAQRAGAAALARGGPCEAELRAHVARYERNRDAVLAGLRRLGDAAGAQPTLAPAHGAFYVYADLGALGVTDAPALCAALLEDEGVAITPGTDFEDPASGLGARRVRFSYAGATAEVEEAMARLVAWWPRRPGA